MDTGAEAVEIANDLDRVLSGRDRAATYLAIGMVLGASAADAERPDVCGLMEVISMVAHEEFAKRRSN